MGGTGLGKTHLSSAIAKEVINAGYAVIYDSAQNVFGEYEDNHFGRAKTDVKRFENADLLIIDDLGAEFVSSFSVAAFYNLLNVRARAATAPSLFTAGRSACFPAASRPRPTTAWS